MVDFPVRGQKAPNYWDDQLKTYIDTGAAGAVTAAVIAAAADASTKANTAQANAIAASQPVDSDLTAIAALGTTAYGRGFLTLANQAALIALVGDASATAKGVVELATDAEALTGTDTVRAITPANLQAKLNALLTGAPAALDTLDELAAAIGDDANYAASVTTALSNKQPLDSDLTAIAALTTTAYGRAFLTLADQAALMLLVIAASETVAGKIEIATQTETNTGTDDVRAITPLKLQTRLAAYAQPLDAELTAIAALTTAANKAIYWTASATAALTDLTATGRSLMGAADIAAVKTLLGIGPVPVRFSADVAVIGVTGTDRAAVARTITSARMRVGTAPAGSSLVVEVQHWNGTVWSVITTLTLAAGSTTEQVSGALTQAQSVGHLLRLNVTSVGSTTAATDVVVDVEYV